MTLTKNTVTDPFGELEWPWFVTRFKHVMWPPRGSFSYRYQMLPGGACSTIVIMVQKDNMIRNHCAAEGSEYTPTYVDEG
jgi:hypothetical protein